MDELIMEAIPMKDDHVNFESFQAVFFSIFLWRGSYILSGYILPNRSKEFRCRILSFLHGLITAFLGINQCFVPDSPFDHPEWKTTYMQSFIMFLSVGYFAHDLAWCLQYEPNDKVMIAHHVYCFFFLIRMLFKGYSGAQCICGLGSMEVTNPFLQTRWFIRSAGMYPSALYVAAEMSFMIVYVCVRIILGTYIMWLISTHPKNEWEFVISSFIIYVISWMFLFQMVNYAIRKYIQKNKN